MSLHFQHNCPLCQLVSSFYTVLSPKFIFKQYTPLIEKVISFIGLTETVSNLVALWLWYSCNYTTYRSLSPCYKERFLHTNRTLRTVEPGAAVGAFTWIVRTEPQTYMSSIWEGAACLCVTNILLFPNESENSKGQSFIHLSGHALTCLPRELLELIASEVNGESGV